MPGDSIVVMPEVRVMYVAGEAGRPIAEQAPMAFAALEAKLPSLRGRKFYGVGVGEEYRACVAIEEADDPAALALACWIIPGGRYARSRIADWEQHLDRIAPAFAALRRRSDLDPARPWIEFYRSRRALLVMVPVR